MSRITRALLCALCLLTFGFAAVPAFALPASPVLNPNPISISRLFQTVTAVGAGDTIAEAQANALEALAKNYVILSYTVISAFCTETPLWPRDPESEMITICSVEIEARVLRKVILLPVP
jgi:hypothetical protein